MADSNSGARSFFQLQNSIFKLIAIILCLAANAVSAAEPGIMVRSAEAISDGKIYRLNAQIDYQLSEQAIEALKKGVALTLAVNMEVWRKRRYWFSEQIANIEQRYQLQFHALTKQYLVTNINSGVQSSFPSLRAALDVLGTIVDFPMLDRQLLERDQTYIARLRASLDIDSLPAPLRILAYLTSGWRLSSDWYSWQLER